MRDNVQHIAMVVSSVCNKNFQMNSSVDGNPLCVDFVAQNAYITLILHRTIILI